MQNAQAFAFAGIWQYRKGIVGDTEIDGIFHSVVTTAANGFAAKYHTRMPLILDADDYETWLTGRVADAANLLRPFGGQLEMFAEGVGLTKEAQT